jgi:hypothetical protein
VKRGDSTDDKPLALKQYHCTRGLCDHCDEKWVYGHKCAPRLQLHVLQKLWDLFLEDLDGASVTYFS